MSKSLVKVVGVYKIEDTLTGDVYVGSSRDIAKRFSNNLARLRRGSHPYFQEAWDDNSKRIRFEVWEECESTISDEELSELEIQAMNNVKKVDGWTLVNKQQHKATRHKVRDTSRMKQAQKGRFNGNCRLSDTDIREIRRLSAEGVKNTELAEKFGVSYNHISRIVTKKVRNEVK